MIMLGEGEGQYLRKFCLLKGRGGPNPHTGESIINTHTDNRNNEYIMNWSLTSETVSSAVWVTSGFREVLGDASLMDLTMVEISSVVKGLVFFRFLALWTAGSKDFLFRVDVLAVESAAFLREVRQSWL